MSSLALASIDLTLLSHVQLRTYFDVAAITITVYDYLLTLNDEISFFWGRPRSWMVSLFFMNRYMNLILQIYNLYPQLAVDISPEVYVIKFSKSTYVMIIISISFPLSCKISIAYILSMSLTGQVIIVEMILCLRLYGIYGNKKVLYFLGVFLGLCLVLCIVILAAIGGGHNAIDSIIATPIGRLPPCRSMASFDKFWLYCIPLLVFESTAFCMVLHKGYQHLRDQRRFGLKAQSNTSRLISVLYRDSILYFAGISLVLVTSCILFSNPDPSYSVLVETLGTGLASIMGGRVLLDVRAASEINESATMGNITTVEFASNSTSSTEVDSDHLSYIGTSWSV